ncbi:MAG: hypothetical protein V7K14_03005 [Nostoc sp.]
MGVQPKLKATLEQVFRDYLLSGYLVPSLRLGMPVLEAPPP